MTFAHSTAVPTRPSGIVDTKLRIISGVEPNDIARLSTALRDVGHELETLSHRVHALAGGRRDDPAMRCAGDCPHAVLYRDALRDEVLARTEALDLAAYTGFVQPELEPVRDAAGAITDVRITYPCDLTAQMLRYADRYTTLPRA